MYSHIEYSVKLLNCKIPFHLRDPASRENLNRIFNQFNFAITKLNFIVARRTKSVNEYRKLQQKNDNLLHAQMFEKKDTKKQQSEVSAELSPILMSITIDTEIYFLYVRILLDSIADLICYFEKFPKKAEHRFSELYYYIEKNGCVNPFLQKYFHENLKWYPLMVETPRNLLTTHDKITSGMSWNDHGVDISVGKSSNQYLDPAALKQLKQIIENHPGEFTYNNLEYIQPLLREIIRKPYVLEHDEIKTIKKISEKNAVFPYIVEVQPFLQEFLNFIRSRFSIASVPNHW